MQRIFSLAMFLCDLNLSAPIRRLTNIKAKNPRLIHVFIPQIARLSREGFAIIGIPHRAANKQSNRNTVQTERACSPACGIVSSAARCRRQTRLRRASITPGFYAKIADLFHEIARRIRQNIIENTLVAHVVRKRN